MQHYGLRTLAFFLAFLTHQIAAGQMHPPLSSNGISFPRFAVVRDSMENSIRDIQNRAEVTKMMGGIYYFTANVAAGSSQDIAVIDLPLVIRKPATISIEQFRKNFHWLPNIKSARGQVVGQHVFRSPCIIYTLQDISVALVPDVEKLANNQVAPYYLDMEYTDTSVVLHYGIRRTKVAGHVYYQPTNESFRLHRPLEISFYIITTRTDDPLPILKETNEFLWTHFAADYTKSKLPQTVSFEDYANTGYKMALDRYWVDVNDSMGGITLSTLERDSVYAGRYFPNDLWYQAWFNNMRTAYGMYSWGRKMHNPEWQSRAIKVIKLLLHAPENKGWFSTVYAPTENKWLGSGSPGFTRSEAYYVPDNCWTAYWALRFSRDLTPLPGIDQKLVALGEALLRVQNADGSFPAGVRMHDLTADTTLDHSASSAMATWYLEELLLAKKIPATSIDKYRKSIIRSLAFLQKNILPDQRFEDFESFFSCSRKPMHYYDSSTAMYNQNTLSMQWCAAAFLKAYDLFKKKEYMDNGEYSLNILSLYQQVWNPPYISLYAFGGFGAQNSDAEWSDARQAQFAETYYEFYKATRKKEYLERAVYACRASFALMVLPENKAVAPNNFAGTRINGELWPGNMAENYGHEGVDRRSYQSGFHWGTGSALTTAAILQEVLEME